MRLTGELDRSIAVGVQSAASSIACPWVARTVRFSVCFAAALLVAAPSQLRAQQGKSGWQLPEDAFVEFRRKRTKSVGLRHVRVAPEPAAGFYEWELDAKKRVAYRSSTLLEILPQLALSLRGQYVRKGSRFRVSRVFNYIPSVGSVKALGSVSTRDASDPLAVEDFGEFKLTNVRADLPSGEQAAWPPNALYGQLDLVDTVVTFTRRVNVTEGRVQSFKARLRGSLVGRRNSGDEPRQFEIEEEWKFVKICEPRYRGFQTRVDQSIAKGCAYLESKLDTWFKNKSLADDGKNPNRSYGTGRMALILLTLLKGEPDRDKPSIQKLIGLLRERKPVDSYSLGVSLMALEAYYGPPNEAEQIREGLIDRPSPRKVSAADRAIMQAWTDRLLDNYDTRVDPGYRLRFNYVKGGRFDNSVTQYAVLGLRSAALCGIEISPAVWLGLAEHYATQLGRNENKKRPLRLPSHGELAGLRSARSSGGTVAKSRARLAEPRGFGYTGPKHPTGSMTCAGLAGTGICYGMLAQRKLRGNVEVATKLSQALRSGFAWLRDNYDVRANPRRARAHFFYYLYGLERACEINGVARIHDRDWYFDGAMQLVTTQRGNGSWGTSNETCFAVLFLKRAVAPVYTSR